MSSAAADRPYRAALGRGAVDALPSAFSIFLSFAIVGAACRTAGFSGLQTVLMAAFVFAAPAQFAVAEMVQSGQTVASLLAAVAVVNLRFLLMSFSLTSHFERPCPRLLYFVLPMLSATTFAVSHLRFSQVDEPAGTAVRYFAGVCLLTYAVALAAAAFGFTAFGRLPERLAEGASIIVAMFLACRLAGSRADILLAALAGFCLTPLLRLLIADYAFLAATLIAGCGFSAARAAGLWRASSS